MATHSYYLDPSVGEGFQVLFERAQSFAARALERLSDPTDSQFAQVFELIFKTPITDAEPVGRSVEFEPAEGQDRAYELRPRSVLSHVRRDLRSFAYGWERARFRALAEVRIHGDGLGRWVQQEPEGYLDPVNYIVRDDSKEEMEHTITESTATLSGDLPEASPLIPEYQHPRRVVVDFTEKAQRKQIPWASVVGGSLNGLHIDDVGNDMLEITLIHEVMHCRAYRLLDFFDEDGKTCGWSMLMGLSKDESYICAESIAMLCLAAALADLEPADLPRGYRYTISSDGEIIPNQIIMSDCTPA
ncbi:hypothetical protein LA080_001355 [Diaporthe eres]|uniref:Uncharacterized protein n=1 Tax=Diaporthe vaccinii TaxID=105482 RepID=A0ABR4DWK0_9PEZI|nr:hypothetical protein LA080_001355 [Diaporthe eres]